MLVVKTHAFTEEKSMNTEIFYKAILLVREPIGALKVNRPGSFFTQVLCHRQQET